MNYSDLKNLPKPLRKLLKAIEETEGVSNLKVIAMGPCGNPLCKDCNEPKAGTGTADAPKVKSFTVGVDMAASSGLSRDGADALAYAFAQKVESEETSTLAKLGEISIQARARTAGDIGNYLRQQIRAVQSTLIDIEFNGTPQPAGHVEHLQARVNHLRNFKTLFEAQASTTAAA